MKKLTIVFVLTVFTLAGLAQTPAIQVKTVGEGAPILFLPGFTTPGSIWNETISHLEGEFQSHLVSYAGFNGLAPIEMPWYATIKKELVDYIVKNDLKDISIVGHSMGGTLGADLAAEIPERISKLLVVDGLPCMRAVMMPNVPAESLQYESPYNNQMLNMDDQAFKQNAAMMAKFMTMKEEKVDTLIQWILEADRTTYVYGYTDLLKLDIRDELINIKAKTLILAAPFPDKATVLSTMENQFEKVKEKEFAIVENSRHFIMFDQEEWFYEKVNTFLSE